MGRLKSALLGVAVMLWFFIGVYVGLQWAAASSLASGCLPPPTSVPAKPRVPPLWV